ncbi:MAG: hypothetical protein LC664_14545 [Flavobacteriales bacterium]|nr:hypothetical protein [Flavobacteriales bacterium]
MITALEVLAVILIALVVGSLFYYGFRRRGPWGSYWTFILVVFLILLLFDVYTEPMGPIYYGIPWIDLIIIGLLFAFLLAASGSRYPRHRDAETDPAEKSRDAVAIGFFFWGLVIFFLIAISFRLFL